jgi:hypothetical protein
MDQFMATFDPPDELNPYSPPAAALDRDDVGPTKTEGIDLSVENPFLTIWTRPRATIRAIVDKYPSYLVVPLAMAAGVVQALDRAAQRNAGDKLPLAGILVMASALGPISGVVGLYIGGALLGWSGRMFGGRAESEEVRAALAWGQVPVLASIPIWLIQLGLIGREMFTTDTPALEANPLLGLALMATGLIEIALAIWCFVVVLKCLGEVHQFSAWRALGSILLVVFVIVVPLLLLVTLVMFAAR